MPTSQHPVSQLRRQQGPSTFLLADAQPVWGSHGFHGGGSYTHLLAWLERRVMVSALELYHLLAV